MDCDSPKQGCGHEISTYSFGQKHKENQPLKNRIHHYADGYDQTLNHWMM
jgi:hypothetical protein